MNIKAIALLIVGIVVVVAVAVVVFGTDIFAEPYWETETGFGVWQTGITIGYTDGTTQELKLIQDNEGSWKPLGVKYQGEEIDWMSYYIKGKVTDLGGYDSIKVDAGGLGNQWYLLLYPGGQGPPQTIDSGSCAGYGVKTLYLNTEYTILNCQLSMDVINFGDDDEYVFSFSPEGNVPYWGCPGGENDKKYAALPPGRTITVDYESGGPGGQIVITLSSEIETG